MPQPTTAEPLDDVAGDNRRRLHTPALISLVTDQVNAGRYRLAGTTIAKVMHAIAGMNPVEAVDADTLPDTDEWADTVTLACGFPASAIRRLIVRTVVAAWRVVAQDLAATAEGARVLVDETAAIAGEGTDV